MQDLLQRILRTRQKKNKQNMTSIIDSHQSPNRKTEDRRTVSRTHHSRSATPKQLRTPSRPRLPCRSCSKQSLKNQMALTPKLKPPAKKTSQVETRLTKLAKLSQARLPRVPRSFLIQSRSQVLSFYQ